ncbi:MAG TPA: DUF4399 domain-containing protein [Gemmatimonadales bacterium]|nr:DUF4399 domain-containing protein [Gemmatimonadales bacterium]
MKKILVIGLCCAATLPVDAVAQARRAAPVKVTVRITSPRNGDTVTAPVTIKLAATGVRIVPATIEEAGTGHHHLFVDHDFVWLNDTIPSGSPGIYHLAKGETQWTLDSLRPGTHRVIAVIADYRHIPLNPLVADTVTFVVK